MKIRFRKKTTPVHVLCGLVCALTCAIYPTLGVMMVLSFMLFEYWQESTVKDTGCLDFWELMVGMFIGAGVLLMRWWLFEFKNVMELLNTVERIVGC